MDVSGDPNQQPQAGDGLPEITGYRIERQLGSGGMSTIYLGEQRSLGRQVAIKVMLPEALADEVSRRRFENEARTIARLEHPYIVGIHEVGRTRDGLPWYAMPYLARGHLGQRALPMDPERVREVLRALLSALAYAHARGVVHRDVKAENVLFDEADRPLLADFGIALRRGYGARVTQVGLAVGSTAYMAPEQARGEEVDARADLYALGVLTHEMLVGRLPFEAADALSMAVMHAQDPVPPLPPALRHWQSFVHKALAKSPQKRFRNAGHMQDALDAVPRQTTTGSHAALARARNGAARLRRLPAAAWITMALVLAAGVGIASRSDEPPGFFRPQSGATQRPLPAPVAAAGVALVAGGEDPMLRAAPESAAERWVIGAERQLEAGRITRPKDDNAFDSVLAAWQADPGHARLGSLVGRVLASLGESAGREAARGELAAARDALDRMQRLADYPRQTQSPALATARTTVARALAARIDDAAARFDRAGATALVDQARGLGLDAATLASLRARAAKVAQPGDRVPDPRLDLVLVRDGDRMLAASRRMVGRSDYAAFATATGRADTLCREKASLLRIVKPRTWREPGYEQGNADAAVCVSFADANAYAQWLGRQSGRQYRLPTADEARLQAASAGSRAVAEWTMSCGKGCGQRRTAGSGWRGSGGEPIDAARGYDDVGFRLVRDP